VLLVLFCTFFLWSLASVPTVVDVPPTIRLPSLMAVELHPFLMAPFGPPTIMRLTLVLGESGGHGGSHKHHHECSCSKNFNDPFQTPSLPFSFATTMPIRKGAVKGVVRNGCNI
jgi:hypothetical protein